jgi:L-alanine-DL-glutamate epimerase-like enolase superfamily enzyme
LNEGIRKVEVRAYPIPTPTPNPESDGTLTWDKTTLVLVRLHARGTSGIGYTYADHATGDLIHRLIAREVLNLDPLDIPRIGTAMIRAIRNIGRPGIASMAISAMDTALWDLKARIFGISLLDLLGAAQDEITVYGSGGFTDQSDEELEGEVKRWLEQGIRLCKIKIGRDRKRDLERIKKVRQLIGPERGLFVDANGAYNVKEAFEISEKFREFGVSWFEEPVSSDDVCGLRFLRERVYPGLQIAAGEYGYRQKDFDDLLRNRSVDCLQADITRCGGVSGFQRVAGLARAWMTPLSCHCAPSLHAILGCALPEVKHLEYFADHARIENRFFEGAPRVEDGVIKPDRSRLGNGIEVRFEDLERFAA